MVRLIAIVCCDECDTRLAEQTGMNELTPLRADIQFQYFRRLIHIRHAGCSGVTVWRIHAETVAMQQKAGEFPLDSEMGSR